MDAQSSPLLVVDNGSGYCKAGFVGELSPRLAIPNAIACSRKQGSKQIVGEAASIRTLEHNTSGGYTLRRPVQTGILIDHEAQYVIWTHIIQNLIRKCKHLDISDIDLVITESFNVPPAVYKDLQQILYEEFKIRSCVILQSQVVMTHAFPTTLHHEHKGEVAKLSQNDEQKNFQQYSFHYNPYKGTFNNNETHTDDMLCYKVLRDNPEPSQDNYHTKVASSAAFRKVADTSRLTVDIGYTGCWATPQYDHVALDFAVTRNSTGAHSLDRELKRLICFRKARIEHSDLLIEKIRKECCEACLDPRDYLSLLERAKAGVRLLEKSTSSPKNDWPVNIYDLEADTVIKNSLDAPSASQPGSTVDKILLGPERFSVVESLFHPDESFSEPVRFGSGINKLTALATSEWTTRLTPNNVTTSTIGRSMGVAELVHRSVFSCPPILQRAMTQSIVLGGGLINTPNLVQRLFLELRSQMPSAWPLQVVHLADKPENTTWIAAAVWASKYYSEAAVRREDYLEGRSRS